MPITAEVKSPSHGRTGTPEEVAAAVAVLLSDDAELITGTGISADGGYTAA